LRELWAEFLFHDLPERVVFWLLSNYDEFLLVHVDFRIVEKGEIIIGLGESFVFLVVLDGFLQQLVPSVFFCLC
jgi:hypothetical protein